MRFTDEQERVIETRGKNLLVSAAAGSGKTAVLVERIFKLITEEDGVDVDRLLVVTFTRAAAAEMKERVRKRLEKALEEDPLNANLLRQESLLHNAQITTIDAFCNYILRENFTTLGIDPAYRIADAGELKLISEDVLEKTLEELFEEGDEAFLHCCEYFLTGGTMDTLKEYIRDLYGKAQSQPDPLWWLTKRPWKKKDITEECLQYAGRVVKELTLSMEKALQVCDEPDGPAAYATTLFNEAAFYHQALSCLNEGSTEEKYDRFRQALFAVTYERLKTISAKSEVDPDKKACVKEARDRAKKVIQSLITELFHTDYETVRYMDETAMTAGEELCDIVLRYAKNLKEAKLEKNIYDFSDIEHLALRILTNSTETEDGELEFPPSAEALHYREHFAEVMIDEYQDSNLIQEIILNAVAEDGRRFMVGDVKQSIYRFRLARPEIFMEKLSSYEKENEKETEAESRGRRIDLHKNFRSRSQILNFTNRVFDKIMAADLGGVEYDEDAKLVVGREFVNDKDSDDAVHDENTDHDIQEMPYACEILMTPPGEDKQEAEAGLVATRILELMKTMQVEGVDELTEEKKMRPLRYSDIVILMRSTSNRDTIYRRVLESRGIPVYTESKAGFFDTREVSCMMNLLSVINNPLQDIPLVSVMHSEIGMFTDAELAAVRVWAATVNTKKEDAQPADAEEEGTAEEDGVRDGEYYYESLVRFAASACETEIKDADESDQLKLKARAFLELLERLRAASVYLTVAELLHVVFRETGYLNLVSAMPGGDRRATNLRRLLEKAKAYENSSYRGLQRFIRYIEQLREYQEDEGESNVLDENADVVRILTIHKSKGLQFPVVFLSDIAKRFNLRDASGNLITDADYGVAPVYIDTEKGFKLSTLRRRMMASYMKESTIGEELRILYVAMTRAEEKLILTTTAEEELNLQSLSLYAAQLSGDMLSYLFRSTAVTYRDFVLAALGADPMILSMKESFTPEETKLSSPDGQFQIRYLLPREDIFNKTMAHADDTERRRALEDAKTSQPDERIESLLRDRFSFSYAHFAYGKLFTKTTVTELKEALRDVEDDVSVHPFDRHVTATESPVPAFMREEEEQVRISGAARGVLYHKMLELLDADMMQKRTNITDRELTTFYETLEENGRLSPDWKQAVNLKDILVFLRTELAGRMTQALISDKLERESQFMMGVPARELDLTLPEDEILLIQGIIDCWFEEDGALVIVDYKTDYVREEKELTDRYTLQLEYYERALRQITGKDVKERILYSFALGKEIKC